QAAAELGAAQREVVAEDVEQRCLGVDVDGVSLAVDREGDSAHGRIIGAHGRRSSCDRVSARVRTTFVNARANRYLAGSSRRVLALQSRRLMQRAAVSLQRVSHAISIVRGQKVMLDEDLALLYGVACRPRPSFRPSSVISLAFRRTSCFSSIKQKQRS